MDFDFLLITIGNTELFRLANEFREKGYTVGIISGSPKVYKDNIEMLIKKDSHYWHINDLIYKYKNQLKYDDKTINQIKNKYGIPCLHNFYFPHFYYRMSQFGFDDFYEMSNHSENDFLFKKTLETFQAIEIFFKENSVKYTIQNLGGEILRRVIFHHNKSYNITNIIISWTPLPGHYVLISNEIGMWDELQIKKYDDLTLAEVEMAQDFINEFKEIGSTIKLRELKSSDGILKRSIDSFLEEKGERGCFPAITQISKATFKKLKTDIQYPRLYKSPGPDERFLFFPLHYHAESRITLRNPHCWRQEFIVEYVARSIPHGYKLYVKPHPEWPTTFPYDSLKLISKISNVALIPPGYKSADLIKRSEGVIVINSTVGFEALIYGKPVIVFGTEFYSDLGMTYDIKNLCEVPRIINDALSSNANKNNLVCFISAFLKANRKGDFSNLNEENIRSIVNGILDYIAKSKRRDDI